METVFLSLPKNEFQAVIIDCVKACLGALPSNQLPKSEVEEPCDIDEAAAFLNLERPTLYRLAQNREIPGHKRGKKWYFYKSELNEWIKSGKCSAASRLDTEAEITFLSANKKRGGIR